MVPVHVFDLCLPFLVSVAAGNDPYAFWFGFTFFSYVLTLARLIDIFVLTKLMITYYRDFVIIYIVLQRGFQI